AVCLSSLISAGFALANEKLDETFGKLEVLRCQPVQIAVKLADCRGSFRGVCAAQQVIGRHIERRRQRFEIVEGRLSRTRFEMRDGSGGQTSFRGKLRLTK